MNRKELFLVSVTLFFTIIAWIIADLYHISTTEQYKAGANTQFKPIKVSLDDSVLKVLEQRR